MTKKNKEKLKEILIELTKIAKKEKTTLDIRAEDAYVTVNNNYWEVPKKSRINFHSFDGGQTWTDMP